MNGRNQSDIDSLLDDLDQGSSEPVQETQDTAEDLVSSENTAESPDGEEEVAQGDVNSPDTDPRGKPWVDFVPEFTHVIPETLEGRLQEEINNKSDILADKEILKLCKIEQGIHRSYYNMWVFHSNALFKNLVRLQYRLDSEKSGKPLREA